MKRLLTALIIGLCLFSSCKDNEWDESAPQTFKLISVQFTPTEEPMEEIFGELNATTFEPKRQGEAFCVDKEGVSEEDLLLPCSQK